MSESRTTLWSLESNLLDLQGVLSARGLGWVDLDIECSTFCPIVLVLVAIWPKRLGSSTIWWTTQIKVNPTKVNEQIDHPVMFFNVSIQDWRSRASTEWWGWPPR